MKTAALVKNLAVIFAAIVFVWAIYLAREALLLIYISLLLAIGLSPLIKVIEHERLLGMRRHVPRAVAILALYLAMLVGVGAVLLLVLPPFINQAADLWARSPELLDKTQNYLIQRGVISRQLTLSEAMPGTPTDAIATLVSALWSVVGGVIGLVTVLILTFYLLLESDKITTGITRLVPVHERPALLLGVREITRKISAWLAGNLIVATAVGGAVAIGMFALGVPYFYVIAVIAGAGEAVPIVGPVIAGVVATLIALTVSWELAVGAAVYFIILQQVESNVLVPKIMERKVGLSPLAVIVALVLGEEVHGIMGAVLAIPSAAIVKVLWEEWLLYREVKAGHFAAQNPTLPTELV